MAIHRLTLHSAKMYKTKITKWKFDKKIKEEEAWEILRLNFQRELCGKESQFRLRGKRITVDDVLRYFKRKGIRHPDPSTYQSRASTSSAIVCHTPCPSPRLDPTQGLGVLTQTSDSFGTEFGDMLLSPQNEWQFAEADTLPWSSDFHQFLQDLLATSELNSHEIPKSPLPPRSFLVMEKILTGVIKYYGAAFSNKLFKTSKNGYLTLSNNRSNRSFHTEFFSFCASGIDKMELGMFVEGRRCFSKASGLVASILSTQHPDSLPLILESVLRLNSRGYAEIAIIIVCFMRDLVSRIPGHPWTQMLSHFGSLDKSTIGDTLLETWRCVCDNFVKYLGQFHGTALDLHADFVLYSSRDPVHTFRKLLEVREGSRDQLGKNDDRLISLQFRLGQALYGQKRYIEALDVLESLLCILEQARADRFMRSATLALASYCKYSLGQVAEAVSNLEKSVAILEDVHGRLHPVTLRFRVMLAGWMRELGRENEANALDAEVDQMIGPDDVGLE